MKLNLAYLSLLKTICVTVLFSFPTYALTDTSKEFTIKAAFIVKMALFIDWPENSSLYTKNSAFTICIEESHRNHQSLNSWSRSGTIKDLPVNIKYINHSNPQLQSCNILFISDASNLERYLNETSDSDVLTISDVPGASQRGAVVNFININNKLRFEINLQAAQQRGFSINSRLLKLAIITNSDGSR